MPKATKSRGAGGIAPRKERAIDATSDSDTTGATRKITPVGEITTPPLCYTPENTTNPTNNGMSADLVPVAWGGEGKVSAYLETITAPLERYDLFTGCLDVNYIHTGKNFS